MEFIWKHGENSQQEYYEAKMDKDVLCVFRNKFEQIPNTWMAMIYQDKSSCMIYDRTANNRQRKKEGLPLTADILELHAITILTSKEPHYLMKKAEYCYKTGKREVSR